MKIKTSTVIWLSVGLIWSLFMGVTAISLGFGSLFPSMNLIAGPFVCANGKMILEENVSNPLPGTTYTIIHWYCMDNQSGSKTELNSFTINFYAGLIYGLLLFVAVLIIWYFYSKWDTSKATPEARKRAGWIQTIVVILIIVGVTSFNLIPLFRSMTATPVPTSITDATATSIALTLKSMSSGTPVAFTSTTKPLARWNNIPIMSQAIAGQEGNHNSYVFQVPVDSGTIETFYSDTLKSLGWTLVDHQWLSLEFTKDKRTLLVTFAPNSDLESWVVTLVLIP